MTYGPGLYAYMFSSYKLRCAGKVNLRDRVRNIKSLSGADSTSSFIRSNEGGLGRSGIVIDLDSDLKKLNIIRCFRSTGSFLPPFSEELKDVKSMVPCMDQNITLHILPYLLLYM